MRNSSQLNGHIPPLRVAIIGMGGFASSHHETLHQLETAGVCQVVATCDPQPTRAQSVRESRNFTARGIRVYDDYRKMLDCHCHEIDFVTIPTPILLHATMHRACIERGLACYLEKPPTLDWQEMNEMLEVETLAARHTQVGFAHIIEEPRRRLKERLISGEFGTVRRVGFAGQWPRSSAYFERTPWAGRLLVDGRLVLDSCTGNAMSHYLHNLLFWCGQDKVISWGEVEHIYAELYRAHAIESFDTCFAQGLCHNGIEVAIAATHTGEIHSSHVEWLECEKATIRYKTGATITYDIAWRNGQQENAAFESEYALKANLISYMAYLRDELTRPPTKLIETRPFVHLNNLLYIAGKNIHTIEGRHLNYQNNMKNSGKWITVAGMAKAIDQFQLCGILPSESGYQWGRSGGRASIHDISRLAETIEQMKSNSPR
jgi:predicted dehydrogenase